MIPVFLSGLVLGASLIIAIGAQNAFILRQGLLRQHVLVVCLICAASDALLIAAGVAGMGTLIAGNRTLVTVITLGGAAFVSTYAALALRRAMRPQAMRAAAEGVRSLRAAVAACLAFTFLNPHVYLDTVVLLGGLSARYEVAERLAFASGAMTASFAWFFSLGFGARLLAPVFARPAAWRLFDFGIAAVMALIAAGLLISLRGAQ